MWSMTQKAVVQRCSVRKGVLRNFTKFTGKHLCQSLFLNKVVGHRAPLVAASVTYLVLIYI